MQEQENTNGEGQTQASLFRAAEYVRMSTEHQQYSTENQADKIREYAARRGIEIIKTYADAGKTKPLQAAGSKTFTNPAGSEAGSEGHLPAAYDAATGRPDLNATRTEDPAYMQEGMVPLAAETHAGEDVGIYALGPSAHLFHGTQEQNVIYHVMKDALKPDRKRGERDD